jgi:ABC-type glycerol-3-phosphate transport system substrate-binding protein
MAAVSRRDFLRGLGLASMSAALGGVLSACAPTPAPPAAGGTTAPTVETTSPAKVSEEKFTLSFIYDVKPEYKKYVDEVLVPKWRETYPGGSVEFTPVPWNNLDEVLMTSKAAGAMPDLFVLGAQMAAKNKLSLPLDDRLAEWADVPDFFDFCWETAQWDRQTWAVPTCMAPRDWCYRKDLTDEAGVTIPDDWTFDDYLAAVPKLTVVENGKLVRMGSTAG